MEVTMAQMCRFVTVNVFTRQLFSGNPLAIVFLPSINNLSLTRQQMLLIAREFNLSETIFVHPQTSLSSEYQVSIFTPATELPFAGHPVIGAGSWLLRSQRLEHANQHVTLVTKSGRIPIIPTNPGDGLSSEVCAEVTYDTRLHKTRFPLDKLLQLHPSLGAFLTNSVDFPIFSIVNGMTQVHIELPSLAALGAVQTASGGEFVPGDSNYLDKGWASHHLVFYFFVKDISDASWGQNVIRTRAIIGQLEDPATGSAACGLAAFLSQTLQEQSNSFRIVQGVEMGRRSEIGVDLMMDSSGKVSKINLLGSVAQVSEGQFRVPSLDEGAALSSSS